MKRGNPLVIALSVAALVTAAACGTGTETPGGEQAKGIQTTQAPTPPDDQLNKNATVNVRLALEPTSMNTFSAAGVALDQILLDNVYQGLVSVDTSDKDKIVPELATSWEKSPDGLTYTFHLVSNAKFHDGAPLTSADVVWSMQQQLAPGSKGLRPAELASVAEVTAPNPTTVEFKLKNRDTLLLWSLAQRQGIIYKAGTDFSTLDGAENGSGPFRMTQWNRGSTITLTRADDYWGAAPKVAKVVFHIIREPNSANNAQLTGQTDIEAATDPTLLQQFLGNDKFTVLRGASTDKFTLAFNNTQAPFTNPDVRHAIRQAINKANFVRATGAGQVIGSPVPPQDPWYEDLTGIDAYNPENAKKLLAAAGFGNGMQLTLDIPNHHPAAQSDVLVSDLKAVGITLTVRQLEFQTWLSKVYTNHDFQLSVVNHAEARDMSIYTRPTYYFGYDNKQVQEKYKQAQTAETDAQRDTLLREVAKQIAQDSPCDWLMNGVAQTVIRKGVYGVPQHETGNRFRLSRLAVAK
ncbi:ABC transporter substrate-binding protein [Nocardia sp. NPDC052566]|uniref:ABC transporter substrate-binding protein n=1 Tax=Nocardia sp. NPDC052566 TaxID=3364330 RepID=UPI0037CADA56